MNLFRSEEHVRGWSLLGAGAAAGIADPRRVLAELFALPRYTRRLEADYLDRVGEHSAGLPDALRRVSVDAWWAPPDLKDAGGAPYLVLFELSEDAGEAGSTGSYGCLTARSAFGVHIP